MGRGKWGGRATRARHLSDGTEPLGAELPRDRVDQRRALRKWRCDVQRVACARRGGAGASSARAGDRGRAGAGGGRRAAAGGAELDAWDAGVGIRVEGAAREEGEDGPREDDIAVGQQHRLPACAAGANLPRAWDGVSSRAGCGGDAAGGGCTAASCPGARYVFGKELEEALARALLDPRVERRRDRDDPDGRGRAGGAGRQRQDGGTQLVRQARRAGQGVPLDDHDLRVQARLDRARLRPPRTPASEPRCSRAGPSSAGKSARAGNGGCGVALRWCTRRNSTLLRSRPT